MSDNENIGKELILVLGMPFAVLICIGLLAWLCRHLKSPVTNFCNRHFERIIGIFCLGIVLIIVVPGIAELLREFMVWRRQN